MLIEYRRVSLDFYTSSLGFYRKYHCSVFFFSRWLLQFKTTRSTAQSKILVIF